MAALSGITAVRPTVNTVLIGPIEFGATIASGQGVYIDTADNKAKLAGNASAALATLGGIAVTPGNSGSFGYIAVGGSVELVGATMAVGETYYAGATVGTIVPNADLSTGHYVSQYGTASSATKLDIALKATGIVHA